MRKLLVLLGIIAVLVTIAIFLRERPATCPEGFTRYYFHPEGSDYNPGTKEFPMQTFTSAKEVCIQCTRCIFAPGEMWNGDLL